MENNINMYQLKIIVDKNAGYKYEPIEDFFGFNNGIDILTEKKSLLAIGADHPSVSKLVKKYQDYFKMFLIPEEPNSFYQPGAVNGIYDIENTFDLIFTICKYTKEWRETYFGLDKSKRIYTFIPWSLQYSYPDQEKIIPVYWTGHTIGSELQNMIYKTIELFNGTIVDAGRKNSVTHSEKMIINGKSKISITYCLLFVQNNCGLNVKSLPNWDKNEAFKCIDLGLIPQMKTRVHEAALSKSIILHKRDEWNIIEDWYTPDEDFIYFDDEKDLLEKINEINKNYDDYKYISDNAYNKIINNYTTEHFIQKYILPNTKLGA